MISIFVVAIFSFIIYRYLKIKRKDATQTKPVINTRKYIYNNKEYIYYGVLEKNSMLVRIITGK